MSTTMSNRESTCLTTRIVEEIAATAGTDPLSLEPPLYHSIDMNALERLFSTEGTTRVEFEYNGHTVAVRSEGTVTVDGGTSDQR